LCAPITLTPPWTLAAYNAQSGTSGGGSVIFTMISSSDGKTITTTFGANLDVDSKPDATNDTNGGTDLIQSANQLESVVLNNSTTLNCPKTPCKIKIDYK
jgi:hypothetical protein